MSRGGPAQRWARSAQADGRLLDRISSAGTHGRNEARDTMRAWERFLTGEPEAVMPARNFVVASWLRSQEFGINPTARAAPLAAHGDSLTGLQHQHADVLAAASAVFARAAEQLDGSGSIMLLTSPEGVVLDVVGDRKTAEHGQDIHLMEGGDWREDVVGTNGIGTALATGRPAQVHAAEHFCEGIKSWTCAACPIFAPGSQSVVGLVDISGPPSTYQRNNLSLAIATAHQIEMVLATHTMRQRMRLLEACLDRMGRPDAAGVMAIDRTGLLVHASGHVPPRISVGQRVPGLQSGCPVEAWAELLPAWMRVEWLSPVLLNGQPVGALLVIPAQRSAPAGARAHAASEADPQRGLLAHIVGRSDAICRAREQAGLLSGRRVPVLVDGETGVGKELFARALHGEATPGHPFVVYNCGAAAKDLLASELFGHVRGAFTGASNEGRPGRFELAHGGTLCLDEIGDLPLDLQPLLLRALEEGVIYRLGDTMPRRVDVRLVAVTNRDLLHEVAAGRFRRDLYHRLGVMRLRIPPLRERGDDIALLTEHFNARLAERHGVAPRRFDASTHELMRGYDWPGNVRELRNVVESLLLLPRGGVVFPDELLATLPGGVPRPPPPPEEAPMSLERTEREVILRTVQSHHGNLAGAARALGISRSTLYRKIGRYGLGSLA